jgi:hypothetical protein
MPGKPMVKIGREIRSYAIFFEQNYGIEAQKTLTGGTKCRVDSRMGGETLRMVDQGINPDQAGNAQNEAAGFFPSGSRMAPRG